MAEAEEGEWLIHRLGNLNADAATNRAQLQATPSLQRSNDQAGKWKARVNNHKKLLHMLLDVSKAVMDRQQGVLHMSQHTINNAWVARWPKSKHGLGDSPIDIVWTLAVVHHRKN